MYDDVVRGQESIMSKIRDNAGQAPSDDECLTPIYEEAFTIRDDLATIAQGLLVRSCYSDESRALLLGAFGLRTRDVPWI